MEQRSAAILQAAQTRDSFYLYDERHILSRIDALQAAFPDAALLYSIKCNPHPHVLDCVFRRGLWADAASAREAELAHDAGLTPDEIYYSAPGKTLNDLERTLDIATLIADSPTELQRIAALAERRGHVMEAGIRVNPAFSFDGGSGGPSKFGIDEDQLPALLPTLGPWVRVTGIHVHLRSQELNAAVLAGYHRNLLALAERLQTQLGLRLAYINMGSGIGIPYADEDAPLDLSAVGRAMAEGVGAFRARFPNTRILLESGRYVVGQSGVYVTRVLDRKISHGRTYLIVKSTLNGFLRPSLARLVAHCGGADAPACEPLFTKVNAFPISALTDGPACERVTVVGDLCTAADVIAEDLLLPHLEPGDLLTVANAGAYAAVLSPMQFSSHDRPQELFLTRDGRLLT